MKNWLLFSLLFSVSIGYCQAQIPERQGFGYLEELQFKKAKASFQLQLQQSANDVTAMVGLGDTWLALQNTDSAGVMYKRALAADSGNAFALAGMGKICLQNNDPSGKTTWFERARRADKTNPEIYCAIAQGCLSHSQKDSATALIYLNQGLSVNPKYARLHLVMGNLEAFRKNPGAAANAYERATFFDPKSAIAYRNLGQICTLSRSYRDAQLALNKSIAIDPDQIQGYKYLGDLYYAVGRYSEAEKSYQIYLERAEITTDDKERFAIVLFFNKKYQEASTLLEQVTAVNHDESVLLRIKGYIAFETGDYQRGLELMNRFFQLHNSKKFLASDFSYYAKLNQKVGNDSLAMNNFKKATALDPAKTEILEELAKLSAKINQHKEAAWYYKQMMDLGADKLVTTFLVGKEFYFEGEWWRTRFDSLKKREKTVQIPFSDSTLVRKNLTIYFSKADSAFTVVSQLNPEYAGSYIWKGRIHSILDSEAETTGAKEAYLKALSQLEKADPEKNQKSIIECCRYLGSYYFLGYERLYKSDKQQSAAMRLKSMEYFTKISQLDPSDVQATEVLSKMKKSAR